HPAGAHAATQLENGNRRPGRQPPLFWGYISLPPACRPSPTLAARLGTSGGLLDLFGALRSAYLFLSTQAVATLLASVSQLKSRRCLEVSFFFLKMETARTCAVFREVRGARRDASGFPADRGFGYAGTVEFCEDTSEVRANCSRLIAGGHIDESNPISANGR